MSAVQQRQERIMDLLADRPKTTRQLAVEMDVNMTDLRRDLVSMVLARKLNRKDGPRRPKAKEGTLTLWFLPGMGPRT